MSDDLKIRIDRAHDMVHALCKPKDAEGARNWTMSIPARPDRDPDLVISDGLAAGYEAINRVKALEAEREAVRSVINKDAGEGLGCRPDDNIAEWLRGRLETDEEYVRSLVRRAERAEAENSRLKEALKDTTSHLIAATSLAESGGKQAAPSDKMFAQMIADYKASVERARAALAAARAVEEED